MSFIRPSISIRPKPRLILRLQCDDLLYLCRRGTHPQFSTVLVYILGITFQQRNSGMLMSSQSLTDSKVAKAQESVQYVCLPRLLDCAAESFYHMNLQILLTAFNYRICFLILVHLLFCFLYLWTILLLRIQLACDSCEEQYT